MRNLAHRPLLLTCLASLVLSLPGCWLLRLGPEVAGTRLAAWRVERVGVVPFADATYQRVGERVTNAFREALTRRLGTDRVVSLAGQDQDIGFIGVGQTQRLGRVSGADALAVGQVLAFAPTPDQASARVVLALRLLDASRGSIIWSRTVSGTAPSAGTPPRDADFDRAAATAAKEFLDDLLAPAPDPAAGLPRVGGAPREP